MKLQKLYIKKFKNLKNFTIDFTKHNGVTLLIGNNGSGKSNLLEAISLIFKNLYFNFQIPPFEYDLTYTTFDNRKVNIKFNKGKYYFKHDNETINESRLILPKKVVAIYSGESRRLYSNFDPFYIKYMRRLYSTRYYDLPQMIYIDQTYLDMALLSLLFQDMGNGTYDKKFIKENLHIKNINSIEFNSRLYTLQLPQRYYIIKDFIKDIESRKKYALPDLQKIWEGLDHEDVFRNLYIASAGRQTKAFSNIKLIFNNNLTIKDLSEGERKQLLIKAVMECIGSEDTLFLLDEPDASIHIANKHKILDLVKEYQDNRSIIITTHSPTLTSVFNPEQIILLENGKQINIPSHLDAIRSLCGEDKAYKILFSRKDILLVEGITDEKYISKALSILKSLNKKYEDLDFEYIPCGGAEGVSLFIEKVKIDDNRTVIALLDSDKPGVEKMQKIFSDENINSTMPPKKKKKVWVLFYPKKQGFTEAAFEVEDYFPTEKFTAYFSQVTSMSKITRKDAFKKDIERSYCGYGNDDFKDFSILFDKILELKSKK